MKHLTSPAVILGLLALFLSATAQTATTNSAANSASPQVPPVIQFSSVATDTGGMPLIGTVEMTFSLYNNSKGGEPLWLETQNVTLDNTGHYSVYVGITKPNGVPVSLFTAGQAHWLGVTIAGEAEQPRVFLVSVPYAMKAGDAATLGGLPPSAFVMTALTGVSTASSSSPSGGSGNSANIGSSGTQNYIPIWTDNSGDLGDSVLYQSGSGSSAKIGLNVTNPLASLDVNGTGLMRGLFEMATTGFATASKGYNSNPLNFESSAFNSGTGKYAMNHFQWQAEPAGNDTKTPSATLNLLYGTDPAAPTETGLKLSSTGVFTFASGQTFPGSGTITGVTAGTDLTGGGASGNVTLNVDTTKVPQLAAANTFTNNQTVNGTLTATSAGVGVLGTSTGASSYGVEGTGPNVGLYGSGTGTGGIGVDGHGTFQGVKGIASATTGSSQGVYGQTSSTAGYGVEGASPNVGVYGVADGPSKIGAGEGLAGLWGDTGAGNSGFSNYTGVLGTANDASAGVFLNNSNIAVTLIAENESSAGDIFYALSSSGDCLIDIFGDLTCSGEISGGEENFKIDHPLDPANKYLVHTSVESSEMMNIYTGNVTTNAKGDATVQLPEWFELLNTDFRYQLTVIGQFAQAIVARKIENNKFEIRTNAPNVEVSWQVTGVRHDAYAKAHPVVVEEEKEARRKGFYLHPELYGAPAEKQIGRALHPQRLKRTQDANNK
jgi:trimeric autotransporter adhesin